MNSAAPKSRTPGILCVAWSSWFDSEGGPLQASKVPLRSEIVFFLLLASGNSCLPSFMQEKLTSEA